MGHNTTGPKRNSDHKGMLKWFQIKIKDTEVVKAILKERLKKSRNQLLGKGDTEYGIRSSLIGAESIVLGIQTKGYWEMHRA